jgi:hypothetical protein
MPSPYGESDIEVRRAVREFRPGLYKHTKTSSFYTAICLVTHHESRMPYVLYVSHTYGGTNIRPLVPVEGDPDAWTDMIRVGNSGGAADMAPRFFHIGDLPSNETIENRDRLHCSQAGT